MLDVASKVTPVVIVPDSETSMMLCVDPVRATPTVLVALPPWIDIFTMLSDVLDSATAVVLAPIGCTTLSERILRPPPLIEANPDPLIEKELVSPEMIAPLTLLRLNAGLAVDVDASPPSKSTDALADEGKLLNVTQPPWHWSRMECQKWLSKHE